jgi:hypothetical protein
MGEAMGTKTTKTRAAAKGRVLLALTAGLAVCAATEQAQAQEVMITGPLAGAPAVRKLRLYREGRFELAPAISFTLLDEYQRTIFLGARLNYNITDWLALGAWGAYGGLIQISTALTDEVQTVNVRRRRAERASIEAGTGQTPEGRLTAVNLGGDFEEQIGTIEWFLAPQITAVPFRGKLALFQSIYLDTEFYFFAGAAFAGVSERKNCDTDCTTQFDKETRVAIGPTAGLGFTFYVNKWSALGFEYRMAPFSRNTGGFDTRGGGKDEKFPDNKITDADREFKWNHMLTISYNFYLPAEHRFSE